MQTPLEALLAALEKGDLDAARQAAAAMRRSALGSNQLAAEVLHELKQPLLGIKAYAQILGEGASQKGPLSMLMAQVDRIEQIIADFIRLASDKPAPKDRLNLASSVRQAEKLFAISSEGTQVSLEVDAAPDIEIHGNTRLIEQLILNLLNNAREAMSGNGRFKLVLRREGDTPVLMVADWGPGIPAELRERIFQPYVTGKSRGSGLGLAVCQRIAQEHGAEIRLAPAGMLNDQPPPSTVFRVAFTPAKPMGNAKPRLLVVDDESIIRMVFNDLMSRECEVLQTDTAEEALEILKKGPVDLIVTDKNLPGMSGLDLAQEARKLDPTSRVILMTGYPSLVTAQQALELGVIDYLVKPFDAIREVRDKLRSALATRQTQRAAPTSRRIDVYEDNPASARQISEALTLLGMEARILLEPKPGTGDAPAGVIVSWDFSPAHGRQAVELGKSTSRGAPFVILAEHLTMETALECLRGGAAACLPKLLADVKALSRELSRALRLAPA